MNNFEKIDMEILQIANEIIACNDIGKAHELRRAMKNAKARKRYLINEYRKEILRMGIESAKDLPIIVSDEIYNIPF